MRRFDIESRVAHEDTVARILLNAERDRWDMEQKWEPVMRKHWEIGERIRQKERDALTNSQTRYVAQMLRTPDSIFVMELVPSERIR